MVNVGYRLQNYLDSYDFEHHEDITPEQVWAEFSHQNEMASSVRRRFPRTARHPLVAMLVCMDARIDTVEVTGDTRKNYYIVRTAGSVINEEEADMLELAVSQGVKLVLLTRHSDCAAEKLARDPEERKKFPALTRSVDARDERTRAFLARPGIASRVAAGELLVKEMFLDTETADLEPLVRR